MVSCEFKACQKRRQSTGNKDQSLMQCKKNSLIFFSPCELLVFEVAASKSFGFIILGNSNVD